MYKFNEDKYLEEFAQYVDRTYGEHYAKSGVSDNKIQTAEIQIDRNRGLEFFLGAIDKYSNRYGVKNGSDEWRKDLLKIMHYAMLALYDHDRRNNKVLEDTKQSVAVEMPLQFPQSDM